MLNRTLMPEILKFMPFSFSERIFLLPVMWMNSLSVISIKQLPLVSRTFISCSTSRSIAVLLIYSATSRLVPSLLHWLIMEGICELLTYCLISHLNCIPEISIRPSQSQLNWGHTSTLMR